MMAAVCPPNVGVVTGVPDIGASGFDFVMEIAGYAVQRQFFTAEGTALAQTMPDGSRLEVTFVRLNSDALGCPGRPLRLKADVQVSVTEGQLVRCSRARITVGADVAVTSSPKGRLTIAITAIPNSMLVTSDAQDAAGVERMVLSIAASIADKLSAVVSLEELGVLSEAVPSGDQPIEAAVYQLGFEWILQVYAARQSPHQSVPRVFLQGDVFTLVLSDRMIQSLATSRPIAGLLPPRMSAAGLVDPGGPIAVTGIATRLESGHLVINWLGTDASGRAATITWRMAFAPALNELALKLVQVAVDGQDSCLLPEDGLTNPIDQIIKSLTPGQAVIRAARQPLGRMRITTGEIAPYGILIAGRV